MRFLSLLLVVPVLVLASGSGELPQPFGPIYADHDTGDCIVTVTAHGGIGHTAPDSAGSGFCFPKTVASFLYYCGMLCGNDSSYIADRFYGNPASALNKDFAIVESLHRDDWFGGQEYTAMMSDSYHPTPKGLTVRMHSVALPAPYGNGVIFIYDYWNNGADPLNGMYAGLWADFDMGTANTNKAFTDPARRLAFMRQQSTDDPNVGIAVLQPHQASNVSVVDHDRYVYPTDTCVTEWQKYRWLNGALHQDSSDRDYDWSVVAASGPFDIPVGDFQRVAFTMIAGTSRADIGIKLDSLQEWFDGNVGIGNRGAPGPMVSTLRIAPNPVSGTARISFGAPGNECAALNLYDRSGRLVNHVWAGNLNGRTRDVIWSDNSLKNGVYFLRLEGSGLRQTTKAVIAR